MAFRRVSTPVYRLARQLFAGRGTGFAFLGGFGAVIVGTTLIIDESNRRMRRKLADEFELCESKAAVSLDQAAANIEWNAADTIYNAVVTRASQRLLVGPMMLSTVSKGDVVAVKADGVGPDGTYIYAQHLASGASGFYPTTWVARVAHSNPAGTAASSGAGVGVACLLLVDNTKARKGLLKVAVTAQPVCGCLRVRQMRPSLVTRHSLASVANVRGQLRAYVLPRPARS
eukprot:6211774-Pleurochrysis_carterae.AAC.3